MAGIFKRILAAAAVASLLASCAKELGDSSVNDTQTGRIYSFYIGDSPSKVLLGEDERGRFSKWEQGDRLGIFVDAQGSVSSSYADVNPGSPVSFSLYRQGGFPQGSIVRAYYPYNSASASQTQVAFSIPAVQHYGGAGLDFDAMPMVSGPLEMAEEVSGDTEPVGELYFVNLASVAEFSIYSSSADYRDEKIESVSFSASAPLAGAFTADISSMDIYDPATLEISGYGETTVTTSVDIDANPSSDASGAPAIDMVLAPGSYSGTVTVTTDRAVYVYTLSSAQTFRRSAIRRFDVDLAGCSDRTPVWEETTYTVNKTISQILSYSGITPVDATKYECLKVDDVISIETNGYNNCGRYYSNGSSWRIYAADYGNIKIKAAEGYELRSVTLTYTINSGSSSGTTVTPSFDGPASGRAQSLSSQSVTWHVLGAAGHIRVTRVAATYVDTYRRPQRIYLDCNEIPEVNVSCGTTGRETFGDDDASGNASWFGFDTDDSGLRVITHTFVHNGAVKRNYTSMMDESKRCPLWVAYPMHGTAYHNNGIGRGKFDEKTCYDPAIPASWQSSGSTSDYNNGNGYSRGHLCASEDRQVTDDSNWQTFYYTNQAPQWQNSFNSGVWSSLESAVQSKAATLTARDTLYVVSGTLYESGTTGSSNDGGTVARPSHFYKLLMLCSFDTSGNMTDAKGAAYLYENRAHSGASYSATTYRTTIDAIEERTGFDFYTKVPAALQDRAEASFTSLL